MSSLHKRPVNARPSCCMYLRALRSCGSPSKFSAMMLYAFNPPKARSNPVNTCVVSLLRLASDLVTQFFTRLPTNCSVLACFFESNPCLDMLPRREPISRMSPRNAASVRYCPCVLPRIARSLSRCDSSRDTARLHCHSGRSDRLSRGGPSMIRRLIASL